MKVKPKYISLDATLTGRRIHNIITENGYSIREFQKMLNLECPQPIYRWIHGSVIPSVDNLYKMSRIFDMHMEDLLVEKDPGDKME